MYNDVTEQNLKTCICAIVIEVFALTKKPQKHLKNVLTYGRISTTGRSLVRVNVAK